MPRHSEIGEIRTHPNAVDVVQRTGSHAFGFGVILVERFGIAGGDAGVPELARDFGHVVFGVSADWYGTVAAVKIVRAVGEVVFGLSEIGQRLDESPLRRTELRPLVIIFGYAPKEHLPVDGAGAAAQLAARERERLAPMPCVGEVSPSLRLGTVRRVPDVVAELHVVRHGVEIGVIGPRLQQQNGLARVLAKPRRQDRPGGTRAHYYIVVPHNRLPRRRFWVCGMKRPRAAAGSASNI